MSRRSTPQKKTDDRAFPVRVKIAIPALGLRASSEIHDWLRTNFASDEFANHAASSVGCDATAFYFRSVEMAQAFIRQFPDLELADGTRSASYTSPAQSIAALEGWLVCNLYSLNKGQAAIRELVRAISDSTGNLPPLPSIFPDAQAPVVRNQSSGRELTMMRWGMPSPAFALKNRKTDSGVANVRNTMSPHWRRWLGTEHRCLVPFTSFCEYDVRPGKGREPVWFALGDDRPLAFFAGIWTNWTSVRKLKDGETNDNLFGFLTTDANAEVGPVHPKAMPVILTDPADWETWLNAPQSEALELQRPLESGALKIVAKGERSDP